MDRTVPRADDLNAQGWRCHSRPGREVRGQSRHRHWFNDGANRHLSGSLWIWAAAFSFLTTPARETVPSALVGTCRLQRSLARPRKVCPSIATQTTQTSSSSLARKTSSVIQEDRLDRIAGNVVPEVLQRAADTRVADQTAEGQDLDGEEIGRREHLPMSGKETRPRRPRAALRCGLDAVVLQDCLDRVPSESWPRCFSPPRMRV